MQEVRLMDELGILYRLKHALFVLMAAAGGALAQPLPVLHFDAPKGFTGSLGRDPSAHVSMNGATP
jgi:hypothetical protein